MDPSWNIPIIVCRCLRSCTGNYSDNRFQVIDSIRTLSQHLRGIRSMFVYIPDVLTALHCFKNDITAPLNVCFYCCIMTSWVRDIMSLQLKSFPSLHLFIILSFWIYRFIVVNFQINRFFSSIVLSFYRFIVLSLFGKKHRVYSIVLSLWRKYRVFLSFYRFLVSSFYRFIVANLSFYRCVLSFYRCRCKLRNGFNCISITSCHYLCVISFHL